MKDSFIRLTLAFGDGKHIYLRANDVRAVYRDGDYGTRVYMGRTEWLVKESAEDVLRLLGGYDTLEASE